MKYLRIWQNPEAESSNENADEKQRLGQRSFVSIIADQIYLKKRDKMVGHLKFMQFQSYNIYDNGSFDINWKKQESPQPVQRGMNSVIRWFSLFGYYCRITVWLLWLESTPRTCLAKVDL